MAAQITTTNSDTFEVADESDYSDASSLFSDTTTLDSLVTEHITKYNRRFNSYRPDKYHLPNDETEQNRMDMVNALWGLRLDGRLFLSEIPEEELKNVLDLGTGTGALSIDIGDTYPDAKIIGTDISPIQPRWVPPNVHFQIDDFEDPWTFSEKFNLIILRSMFGCVRDWKALVNQAFQFTAPGGYIEIQDMELRTLFSDDGSMPDSFPPLRYTDEFSKGLAKIGANTGIDEVIEYLNDTGYTNITRVNKKFPIGIWPKDTGLKYLGKLLEATLEFGFEAYGLKIFTDVLGWSEEKARAFIADAVQGMKNRKVHSYVSGYVVYAQKPIA